MQDIVMMIVCFSLGYAVSIYVNRKSIAKAKKDIRYVNTLKSKEYNRGYKSALTYRKGLKDE